MASKKEFENAVRLAINNIVHHGDTDIFPFPFERFMLHDKTEEIINIIHEYNEDFKRSLAKNAPSNVNSLSPVNYFGFRWATQIDYIWNVYFLACVLVIWRKIEAARIGVEEECVFSYRLSPNNETGALFNKELGFRSFMNKSFSLASEYEFVTICDISEFYPRLGHHRLENALMQIDGSSGYSKKIMGFLSNFSRTNSFGLPIGGPAARILSELTINQIDRLLLGKGIKFTRFADDYHIFSKSQEDAYASLIFLSEKLFMNQGLTLQKSKTRIMSGGEFRATMPPIDTRAGVESLDDREDVDKKQYQRENLLAFSLRFDPYSPNAKEEYEQLKSEIQKYDVLSILKDELKKTRVHTALTKKLINAIKYMDESSRNQAIISVMENIDILYPIFSSVLLAIEANINEMSREAKNFAKSKIIRLIKENSHVFRVDVHLAYAVRVLFHFNEPDVISILQNIYEERSSPIIRRDIILTMARHKEWYWLSDLKNKFRQLSAQERRAFIVASFVLKDEGNHWRNHIESELTTYESLISKWAKCKLIVKGGSIVL